MEKKFQQNIGYWNSRFFNELNVVSWFFEGQNFAVILKCPKRTLEYYLSKELGILECNNNNLAKILNEVKQIIHVEETDNSDYVMTFINTITSTSNTLKKLLLHKILHSSYIQK